MKYIVQIFILVLLISSCKAAKDIPAIEEKKEVEEQIEEKFINTASHGKSGKSDRLRKPMVDPDQIIAQLNMNESQEKSFLDFWERNQLEMDKIREDKNGDRAVMRERMKAFRESSRSEIEKILTPEQFAQYKRILAKDRMKSRRGN